MAPSSSERADLKDLQERLTEKEGFEEAMQRLRRTQRMIAYRKPEVKVVFYSTCGKWRMFRACDSCRE